MKELLEAYLGKEIVSYRFNQWIDISPSSDVTPQYVCKLNDGLYENVELEDILVFLFNRTENNLVIGN